MATPSVISGSNPSPKETRERACPHCDSAAVQARVRVFADNRTGRIRGEEYRCRECAKEFMLRR